MKNQLAKEVIEYKILLDDLQEKTKQVKALLIQTEDYLIDLLKGTGETIESSGYYISCNAPTGSAEILKDVPKDYCTVKEIYNPDKKRIKEELQSGVALDFAEIVYNTKLTIKEVKND